MTRPTSRSLTSRRKMNSASYERFEKRMLLTSFVGTESSDVIFINIMADSLELTINSDTYSVDSPDEIDIDGLGGRDLISISRPDGMDAVFENGAFSIGGFKIALANIESVDDVSGGFTIAGTDADDVLTVYVGDAPLLNDSTFGLPGFDSSISVEFDGGAGHDQIITQEGRLITVSSSGNVSWVDVEEVLLNARGDFTTTEIVGTDGDDTLTLVGSPSPPVWQPSGGPAFTFDGISDLGLDLHFLDSTGNDSVSIDTYGDSEIFTGSPASSHYSLSGGGDSFEATFDGFNLISVRASGGTQFYTSTATISGTEGDESVVLEDDSLEVSGDSWAIKVEDFERTILDFGGGVDRIESVSAELHLSFNEGLLMRTSFPFHTYSFRGVGSLEVVGDTPHQITNLDDNAELEIDYSASPNSLRSSLYEDVRIMNDGDFQLFGQSDSENEQLHIIAPVSEDARISSDEFSSAIGTATWSNIDHVSIEGQNDDSTLALEGSSGPDRLIFNGSEASFDSAGVSVNAKQFTSISIDAGGGDDAAFLRGAEEGGNTFLGNATSGVLTTPSMSITATSFDLVGAVAGGPGDQATLIGTSEDEQFYVSPTTSRMVGAEFVLNAAGFEEVLAEGEGDDFANVMDSVGDDSFIARPGFATVEFNGGPSVVMNDFRTVRSVSSRGADEAVFEGSAESERFVSQGDRFGRLNGGDFSFIAVGYPSVIADGLGGKDVAFMTDSEGDDSFVASAESSSFSGDGFSNSTIGFEEVFGFTTDGNDVAELRGSESDESFYANPAVASLTAGEFLAFTRGFNVVRAIGGGGNDIATLRDSEGNDLFTSSPALASLQGTGFRNVAEGFSQVKAISIAGVDQTVFEGSTAIDNFVGNRDYSYLEGNGFRNQANGFEDVSAVGLAGLDTVSLFDSEEDETFVGRGDEAILEGETFIIQLADFDSVSVFGFNGGTNTSTVDDPDFDWEILGSWD